MNRVAVFVRGETLLDHAGAIASFATFAERAAGVALLRVYWYDGTSTGPTAQHLTLAHLDNVKVRLGFVNSVGEQKGVDSLIVTDMIALARNRAICDAVLVSGDEDLRVGVQQAQEFGVRVHLVGIKPSRGSQSLFLLQEADTTHEWTDAEVAPFLSCKPKARVRRRRRAFGTYSCRCVVIASLNEGRRSATCHLLDDCDPIEKQPVTAALPQRAEVRGGGGVLRLRCDN
jgi:hypothetical protein